MLSRMYTSLKITREHPNSLVRKMIHKRKHDSVSYGNGYLGATGRQTHKNPWCEKKEEYGGIQCHYPVHCVYYVGVYLQK